MGTSEDRLHTRATHPNLEKISEKHGNMAQREKFQGTSISR